MPPETLKIMTRDRIIMILCSQEYPEFMLEQTADKLERLAPDVAKAFGVWAEYGETPSLAVGEWTYSKLMEKFNMRPVAAFLALDWLIREPEKAEKALKRGIK